MEAKKAIEKAIDLWERVVQLNPTHLDAIFLLARTGAVSSLFFFSSIFRGSPAIFLLARTCALLFNLYLSGCIFWLWVRGQAVRVYQMNNCVLSACSGCASVFFCVCPKPRILNPKPLNPKCVFGCVCVRALVARAMLRAL